MFIYQHSSDVHFEEHPEAITPEHLVHKPGTQVFLIIM